MLMAFGVEYRFEEGKTLPLELKMPWRHTAIGIVDDNVEWRRVLRNMLSGLGVGGIVEASDGSDFLKKMEKVNNNVDLILVDDEMIPMDGFVLMYSVRARAKEPLRRVIGVLMAGEQSVEISRRAEQVGYNSVLPKPFSGRELEAHLQRIMMAPVQWREVDGLLRPILMV